MTELPGSTAVGTPAAALAAESNGGTSAPSAWTDAIADQDLRGFVSQRGWKDPGALAESYRNLEKLTGVPHDRLLKLPADNDADGWNSVWGRLGRPETPDGYQLNVPEGASGDFAKKASAKFHELGIPAKQAQALAEWWNNEAGASMQSQMQAREQQAEIDMNGLRQEWGNSFDAEIEKGRRAVRQFGIDQPTLEKMEDALGTAEMMRLFNKIGSGLGEASFEGGNGGSQTFGTSREAAAARINELKGDQEWTTKYLSGDASAKAEMTRLMQLAYGG